MRHDAAREGEGVRECGRAGCCDPCASLLVFSIAFDLDLA